MVWPRMNNKSSPGFLSLSLKDLSINKASYIIIRKLIYWYISTLSWKNVVSYFYTSNPPRLCTGAMLISKYFLYSAIYEADLGGNAGRGRPRRTFSGPNWGSFGGQVKSIPIRRACMRNLMTVEEAQGVCKDRNKWKEGISAYPKGKRAWCYVCMYI
jgi:hypothetical protein